MKLEWLCGSVYKVFVDLLDGTEKTETQIAKETGYNHIVVKTALRILTREKIVICRENKYAKYCQINEESEFVKAFREFVAKASIELPKLRTVDVMHRKIAIKLVEYLINNWNKYVTNIKDGSTIKIYAKEIGELICNNWRVRQCNGKRQSLGVFVGWVINEMIEEFKKRGFEAWRDYEAYRTVLYVQKP